jgi:hypothetical protein
MMQLSLSFDTASPINIDRLKGQNLRLYNWLQAGNSIHVFHPAKKELRIGYLNSRASDLINKNNVPVNKRRIQVPDISGELVTVVEYSLK